MSFRLLFLFLCVTNLFAQKPDGYLSNFDILWNEAPKKWDEGAFTGNGKAGAMIWQNYNGGIRFDIGNTEVYNGRSRVPMGKLILSPSGEITDYSMRLSLEKGLVTASSETTMGSFSFKTFTERETDLQRIAYKITGDEKLDFDFLILPPIESNVLWSSEKEVEFMDSPDFSHPSVIEKIKNHEASLKLQPVLKGEQGDINYQQVFINETTGYVLVWTNQQINSTSGQFVYASYYFRDKEASGFLNSSLKNFKKTIKVNWSKSLGIHESWWSNFYSKGQISIPDKKVEANYWAQYYKIGSAIKKGGMPLDLLGPWFRATPWPRIWSNLNVQITYPILNQLGKFNEGNTLFDYIDNNNHHFINAVPLEFRNNGAAVGRGFDVYTGTNFSSEYGNFLWLLYNYSQFLEFFPDEKRELQKYYPLLKRGINFVIRNLIKDKHGVYHFPEDVSPEYFILDKNKNKKFDFPDTNYNISLLDWALTEALNLESKNNINSLEGTKYKEVLENLVPLQIDDLEGLMVAKDIKMSLRHRHPAHLMAFYPLATLDVNDPDEYSLIDKSVVQWLNRPRFGWGYKGYTYTMACAMYARMNKGDEALGHIQRYINEFSSKNTFYLETGPVIETTMNSASVTLELLIQSFSFEKDFSEIKVFTAVPSAWENASFYKVTTEGGYLVSGVLANGKLKSVKIEVKSSGKLKLVIPKNSKAKYSSRNGAKLEWIKDHNDFLILTGNLKEGDVLTIDN